MIIWWGLHDVIRTYIIFNISLHNCASRVAQRKRAGPITQRSEDQNLALLEHFSFPIFSNFFLIPFFFILYFSHFFIFIFIIQEDLSEAELNRLDTVFKKLYLEKYPKVGYVEGHEPNHEDNLTIRKNKNIELWVVNVQF